eukprot:1340079-Pleurochrysis_carterae.AAC.2
MSMDLGTLDISLVQSFLLEGSTKQARAPRCFQRRRAAAAQDAGGAPLPRCGVCRIARYLRAALGGMPRQQQWSREERATTPSNFRCCTHITDTRETRLFACRTGFQPGTA